MECFRVLAVLTLISSVWLQVADCTPIQTVRTRRQFDFVFPDDNEPNGIPTWIQDRRFRTESTPRWQDDDDDIINTQWSGPMQSFAPPQWLSTQAPTTTRPLSPGRTVPTTPSPSFLRCLANCPTTSEYNPICGSDEVLYYNSAKFGCAQRCGADVKIIRYGNCRGIFPMTRG